MLPNLERALKIEVTKSGDEYRADARLMPGTPPVGRGATEDAAKYNLCVNLLYIVCRRDDRYGRPDSYKEIIIRSLRDDLDQFSGAPSQVGSPAVHPAITGIQ